MLLSIVIVNYNTRYFLEQCLCSVYKSIASAQEILLTEQTEIIVVDNYSADNSVDWLRPLFPAVCFIANAENVGFARANNQALTKAIGKFILFLNPDTILSENALEKCLRFASGDEEIGALGVRMIDGSGQFLPESKRGFPAAWVAFFKMAGLGKLFPRSKIFSRYHLGHLPEALNHSVDVLSGAFMLIQRKVIDQTGGFDEQFFMYGEDIDLSYRIKTAGYKNFYLGTVTIIHFKGESTKKDRRYVQLFYGAMVQFITKHFKSGLSLPLLKLAIGLRSRLARVTLGAEESPGPAHLPIRSFLTGDPQSVRDLEMKFPLAGRVHETAQEKSDETIFCEGQTFSFARIIQEISTRGLSVSSKIHSSHSHSVAGSRSRQSPGEAFEV